MGFTFPITSVIGQSGNVALPGIMGGKGIALLSQSTLTRRRKWTNNDSENRVRGTFFNAIPHTIKEKINISIGLLVPVIVISKFATPLILSFWFHALDSCLFAWVPCFFPIVKITDQKA